MTSRRVFTYSAVLTGLAGALPVASTAQAAGANPAFDRHAAGSNVTVDHSAWDKLLAAYVVSGADGLNRVAYAKFKGEGHAALKAYLAALQAVDPAKLDRAEQFAFWVNLYNARTIDVVLDKYPVKSIKDISLGGGLKTLIGGGPWQARIIKVKGVDLTLDDVENTILRPVYGDPRVHYAVNCASVGCPNLAVAAYTGAKLDAMLDAGAKSFIGSPRGILVEGASIKASSIYEWFQADFGGSEAAVLAHLRKFADPSLSEQLTKIGRIARYDYDWKLADATS